MTKWIPNNPPHDLRPRCSACGNLFPVYTDYCPNCGGKMLNGKERQELRAAWVVEHQEAITSSAIRTLTEEYRHVCLHLLDGGKSPEYYIEMQQLATALEMGISALARGGE